MADAETADVALPARKLLGLIRVEWESLETDNRTRFIRIGGYLHDLRPPVPERSWKRYVAQHLPFSYDRARRYERFYLDDERARQTGSPPPRRVSDVWGAPRPAH